MSIRSQLVQVAVSLADRIGSERALDAQKIIDVACRRAGHDDFGQDDYGAPWQIEAPLRLLLAAFEEEAHLSPFGRLAARWDMGRLLQNVLLLRSKERERPAVLDEAITAPVFITGMPRSGTSFLHALLAQDPAHRAPRCWQTIHPYPAHSYPGPNGIEAAIRNVERQLRLFDQLAPGLHDVHPTAARDPQECVEINAHVLQSLRFDMTHYVPSYRSWLDRVGHAQAYRFHRRFLRHLQHQETAPARRDGQAAPPRWVLKSPDHVVALDALRAAYPDARIVMLHRDPVHVLASVARLTELVRMPFAREIDRAQIGRQVSDDWAARAAGMMRAADSGGVVHLHYRALVADPLGAVRRLYAGLLDGALPAEAEARMRALIDRRPRGGYGRNSYSLADFGLDADTESARFAAYAERFGVERGRGHEAAA
jgi:hypothetical protein